ncbi:MAG TPA: hypothetical protein VF815_10240 [Myxococcaceae bacterium]|jgi:hypothetical protein
MLPPRVLPLLLLLASSTAFAQSPPPLVPAPSQEQQPVSPEEQPTPEGEIIPHRYEPTLAPAPGVSAGRVMLELLGGVVGGLGGTLVGGIVAGALVAVADDCVDGTAACETASAVIIIPSIALGMALGVYAFGKLLGGKGSFSATLLGLGVGLGTGLLAGLAGGEGGTLVVGVLLGPLIGAIIGYEVSSAGAVSSPTPDPKKRLPDPDEYASRPRLQWSPMVGTTPRGGIFAGISGGF